MDIQPFTRNCLQPAMILVGILLWVLPAIGCAQGMESVYTELSETACPVEITNEETGSTRQLCPGVGGYALVILYDDLRITIDVIAPSGEEFPLNYWGVISGRFTSHGKKAEWRVAEEGGKLVPKALIVRVDEFGDPDRPQVVTSYLAVAKILPGQACVTDRIAPGPGQNDIARRAADSAASKPCLPPLAASSSHGVKMTSGTPAKFLNCDVWGANLYDLDLPPFNEKGVHTKLSLTGPFPEVITQVWQKQLKVDPQDHSGRHHSYCLTADSAVYGMFLVNRSETEGTSFWIKEFDSISKCNEEVFADIYDEQVLPFPKTPLSRNCPFLMIGAARDQIEKHLGQGHMQHGQSSYYLQLTTPEFRNACRNWLDVGEDYCCYPGMSLTFSGGRLTKLTIHDGHGEGPPCDEYPTKTKK